MSKTTIKPKKRNRKIIATACTLMLASSLVPATAIADELDTPVLEEEIEEYSTDPEDIIATAAGSISNGGGSLFCNLGTGNFYSTIQVRSGNNLVTGSINCFVKFPDGTIYNLGSMLASNGATIPANFFIAPYGQYEFIFSTSLTDELEVQAFIFD